MKRYAPLLIALLLLAGAAHAQASHSSRLTQIGLDRDFGSNGRLETRHFEDGYALDAVAAGRGSVLLGGYADTWNDLPILARYRGNGDPLSPFGESGAGAEVYEEIPHAQINALAVDSMGRIVASLGFAKNLIVARFLTNGKVDASFGDGGSAVVPTPPEAGISEGGRDGQAASISVDDRDRIVVGRAITSRTSGRAASGYVLARFNENGSLDSSYGEGGLLAEKLDFAYPFRLTYATPLPGREKAIVVATSFEPIGNRDQPELRRFEVAQLLPNGSLDPAFGGGDGRVSVAVGREGTEASVVDVDRRGRLVIGGANPRGFGLVRLLPDGRRDLSFGDRGRVNLRADRRLFGWGLETIAIDHKNRIHLAGPGALPGNGKFQFLALRLRADARLDRGFGRRGTCFASFPSRFTLATAITPTRDGDAIVSGYTARPRPDFYPHMLDPITGFALARCEGGQ